MSLSRKLVITRITASILPGVGSTNSKVYAEVTFGKLKIEKTATCSGKNPAWNDSLGFSIRDPEISIKLYRKRASLRKYEYIGGVKVSLSQLSNQREENNKRAMSELPLKKGDVTTGTLGFSYNFENQPHKKPEKPKPDEESFWRKILISVSCARGIEAVICCAGGGGFL